VLRRTTRQPAAETDRARHAEEADESIRHLSDGGRRARPQVIDFAGASPKSSDELDGTCDIGRVDKISALLPGPLQADLIGAVYFPADIPKYLSS
jgi:hypothetical protein